ncbi:alkaline proteinase [Colletotrichum truncatum]|uniref:Alkaline proteinase n=1 Tax=Colletotrichum truncatum TaxID=5467 RepID=A0ACC3YE52_COLTU|nr:alkaline proteinase [Colletotrichum truncatum]KAF6790198.1 alkaline proteinase [Colletotrichum truncatum]
MPTSQRTRAPLHSSLQSKSHKVTSKVPQQTPSAPANHTSLPPHTSRSAVSSKSPSKTSQIASSNTVSSTSATTSAASKTVENGKVESDLAVGMIVAAGVGGGYLLIAGQYFSLAAGSVAQVTGASGIASGVSSISGPEPQQVENPEEDPGNRQPTPTGQRSQDPENTTQPPMSSFTPTSSSPISFTSSSQSPVSSSAAPRYIIVPESSSSGSNNDFESVRSSLSESVGNELVSVSDDEDKSILFLTAPLSPAAAKDLTGKAGVGSVSEDFILGEMKDLQSEPPFNKEDAAGPSGPPPALAKDPLSVAKQPKKIVRQTGYGNPTDHMDPEYQEALELSVLSQEPGKSLTDTFVYDEVAGQGITVYILGSGMNLKSPDIENAVGGKDFLYAPGADKKPTDDYPDIGYPEGTCAASKIFGPQFGVAKKANVVMVKLSGRSGMIGAITMTEMLTALALIKNDIHKRGIKGKAVVNLSYTTPIADKESIESYKEILVKMMQDDIVLVAPTGISNNNRGSEANDQYPAAFAKDTDLIAVNAVSSKGLRLNWSPGSEKDGVTVAAPATGFCAYKAFNPKDRATPKEMQDLERRYYSEGVAAATVAGVVATLLAQDEYKEQLQQPGKVASNVKELLQGLAWVRAEGGPPIVWNGVKPVFGVCRRQEGDSCSSAAPSGTPTAAPTSLVSKTAAVQTTTSTPKPSLPPKPTWNNIPSTWKKQYEGDVSYSFDYTSSSSSSSEGYTGDPLPWCLDKCKDGCKSVFLTRVAQEGSKGYNIYYICNQYDRSWSNDFLQKLSSSDYDAGIALDKVQEQQMLWY